MSAAGPERAYVGIGANLGDAAGAVELAIVELGPLGLRRASSLYRTEPLGPRGQPWYVNAVAELETGLGPRELLASLHAIEARAGRRRELETARWGPRALDLDLLLLGDRVLGPGAGPGLPVLPHPGLASRRFVLEPLVEIAPGVREPLRGRRASELLAALDDPLRVEKLPPKAQATRRPPCGGHA